MKFDLRAISYVRNVQTRYGLLEFLYFCDTISYISTTMKSPRVKLWIVNVKYIFEKIDYKLDIFY